MIGSIVANDGHGEAAAPVDLPSFRNGMARLAAAVNIVTSAGPEGWCGFTASAVSSVTDSPPTLLVCINKTSQSYLTIRKSGVLCVNSVASGHKDLSVLFSGASGVKDMAIRFSGAKWSSLVTGAPVLDNAVVSFDCRVVRNVEIGTHGVFFCQVVGVRQGENVEGLVYFDRRYHRVA